MIITKLMMILALVGALGSGVVAVLWGGWSQPMTVLCIMMGLDYVSGVVVALVFRNSPKTENGGMSSLIGLKGLLRKMFLILVVAAAYQIDRVIGTSYIRDAAAIAFIANEALSLLENAGLMGIPIPQSILKGIDVLKGRAEAGQDGKPPNEESGKSGGTGDPSPTGDGGEIAAAPYRGPRNDRTGDGGEIAAAPAGSRNDRTVEVSDDTFMTRSMPIYPEDEDPETEAILLGMEPDGAGEDEDGTA